MSKKFYFEVFAYRGRKGLSYYTIAETKKEIRKIVKDFHNFSKVIIRKRRGPMSFVI